MKIEEIPAELILRVHRIVPEEGEEINLLKAEKCEDGSIALYFSTNKYERVFGPKAPQKENRQRVQRVKIVKKKLKNLSL